MTTLLNDCYDLMTLIGAKRRIQYDESGILWPVIILRYEKTDSEFGPRIFVEIVSDELDAMGVSADEFEGLSHLEKKALMIEIKAATNSERQLLENLQKEST